MTSLHAYFHNRDQAAFQRQLSLTDVNARDRLGRTVLHLACAASARAAIEYVRILLAHPSIDVNLQDVESHWTALHRALYNGNIFAAILLLQRDDTDSSLKDFEGYRAFDLYNTTVEDTMPSKRGSPSGLELYTWGSNKNASLGHGDTDDRTYPEQVVLSHHEIGEVLKSRDDISFKLQPAMVCDVQMSRLHTVVLTDESRANIRACGFASAGRLGPGGGQHTQPSFLPTIKPDSETVFTAIALGQDHTLALTLDGTVLSWGLGRFSQLGYEVPPPHVQSLPRVIAGPLRRTRVRGIAACKSASACWTDSVLYTWGKNNGQLGYDKDATPVQTIPRVVTKVTKRVISVALNDTAMACLLATQEVILLFNDMYSRITFPSPTRLPLDFLAYRPLPAARTITTARIFCNENTFATISSTGEIFTFSAPTPSPSRERLLPVQPQRVWALRKQWSAVHDAALGGDGSLIICTQSGHVFVRSRGAGVSKVTRFVRVIGLQRAIAVRASDSGALAALREPYRPPDITPVGNNLAEDLARLRPYLSFTRPEDEGKRVELMQESNVDPVVIKHLPDVAATAYEEDEEGDGGGFEFEAEILARDAREVMRLWDIVAQDRIARRRPRPRDDAVGQGEGLYAKNKLSHGADLMLRVQNSTELPVHRIILSARCAVLARVLGGLGSLHDRESGISFKLLPAPVPGTSAGAGCPPRTPSEAPRLAITGVHPFSVLVLLHYLYTDALLAINDPQLARLSGTADAFAHGRLQAAQAVRELQTLSRVLHLEALADPLRSVVRRAPSPSLNAHFRAIFDAPVMSASSPDVDVVLRLADREVRTHSFVLRARSLFFEGFFVDEDWTRDRWESDGTLHIDLSHLEWRAMQYVLRFMCCGEEEEMFERIDFVESVDQLLSLLFEVMYAANELLLDRMLLICSSIIVKYVTIDNITGVYLEAAFLHCPQLMDSLHQFMAVNMETLLEARLLDDLSPWQIGQLASAVQGHQTAKSPFSRLQLPVSLAAFVDEHREWLAAQDIPLPIVRSQTKAQLKISPKASRRPLQQQPASPGTPSKPNVVAPRTPLLVNSSEDLFCMDEALVPPLNLNLDVAVSASADREELGSTPKVVGPWKAKSTPPRVDMKTILAEAEEMQASSASGRLQHPHPASSSLTSVHRQRSGDGMRVSFSLPKAHDVLAHSSTPSNSRSTSAPAWRVQNLSLLSAVEPPSSSPGRSSAMATTHITPLGSMQASSEKPPASQPFSAPAMQKSKSWSNQSSPGPGPPHPRRLPGLGPVISPSKAKAKAGQTATTHASSGGNVWTLPSGGQPLSRASSSAPISFAEIQQLQSQPDNTAAMAKKERRSLRDIQAEEAELQAEAEFMKWWTAEEERIRLENEAIAASLLESQKPQPQPQQRHLGRRKKKSAATAEGESVPGPKALRGGDRKR